MITEGHWSPTSSKHITLNTDTPTRVHHLTISLLLNFTNKHHHTLIIKKKLDKKSENKLHRKKWKNKK